MRAVAFVLLLSGCAPVEAASPVPMEQPAIPDQSVSDVREQEPNVTITPEPPPKTCREALTRAGVAFENGPPLGKVVDPIRVDPVLGGVTFRLHSDTTPRRLWVDCRFAQRLLAASELLASRGVREVVHVGTYEPKCVGGGTPESNPGCTLSAHALGMAIDVSALVREHDVVEVARDFAKRDGPSATCASPRGGERDAFLKELVCALDGTFSVLLTPNWDWHHRGHFHLALHPPSKTPLSNGVDPLRAVD